jgi:hypothetical protein
MAECGLNADAPLAPRADGDCRAPAPWQNPLIFRVAGLYI